MITNEIRKWLDDNGLVIVPRLPTGAMCCAVSNSGGVSDSGGNERRDFEDEWETAIENWITGDPHHGLTTLVRGVWECDPEPEMLELATSIYPRS